MQNIELISAAVCPFAQRTRMVLHEKAIDFKLTEIDLSNKPDWFDEVSPYGKVPVLKHGDTVLYESAIVNEYLNEIIPEPPLLPLDPKPRALARIWIEYCNQSLIPAYYKFLIQQDLQAREGLRDRLKEVLLFLEYQGLRKLSESGPYWLGETLSLVDLSFYPFFERMVVVEHYRDFTIPDECERLLQWKAHMAKEVSVQKTCETPEFYIEKYSNYAEGTVSGATAQEMRNKS